MNLRNTIVPKSRWNFGSLDHICPCSGRLLCTQDGIWNQSVNTLARSRDHSCAPTMSGGVKLVRLNTRTLPTKNGDIRVKTAGGQDCLFVAMFKDKLALWAHKLLMHSLKELSCVIKKCMSKDKLRRIAALFHVNCINNKRINCPPY